MKYFESNHMANDDFDDLQVRLLKVTAAVASNLTYQMVQDDASEHVHQVTMVKSAYTAILVLEAIAGQFPEDVRREAYEDVSGFNRKMLARQEAFKNAVGAIELEVDADSELGRLIKRIIGEQPCPSKSRPCSNRRPSRAVPPRCRWKS